MNKLTAEQRERYLQASAVARVPPQQAALFMNCLSPAKQNLYSETETECRDRLAVSETSSCGKDTLYFSLRYLPVAHAFSSIKSPPGKSGTTWLTSFLSSEFHQD